MEFLSKFDLVSEDSEFHPGTKLELGSLSSLPRSNFHLLPYSLFLLVVMAAFISGSGPGLQMTDDLL